MEVVDGAEPYSPISPVIWAVHAAPNSNPIWLSGWNASNPLLHPRDVCLLCPGLCTFTLPYSLDILMLVQKCYLIKAVWNVSNKTRKFALNLCFLSITMQFKCISYAVNLITESQEKGPREFVWERHG